MDKKKLKWTLLFGGVILSIISVITLFAPFITIGEYKISGFDLMERGFDSFSSDDYDFTKALFCIIPALFTIINFVIALITAIKTYLKDLNMIKTTVQKEISNNQLIAGIIANIVISIIFIILNMCIVQLTGFDEIILSKLGYGAVLSGIMTSLSTIILYLSNFPFDKFKNQQEKQNK